MNAPRMTVDLIRHAESQMNVNMADPNIVPFIGGRENHIDLSPLGERQARNLGCYAIGQGIVPTMVYSSPAVRARRTQELSMDAMGLTKEPIIDDRLQELDQGSWTNQPRTLYDENQEEMKNLGSRFAPPGGESMNDVAERMHDFMESLEHLPDQEHVWVFTHGVAIKAWIGKLKGWSHEKTYKTPVQNASISRMAYDGISWRLKFFDQSTD